MFSLRIAILLAFAFFLQSGQLVQAGGLLGDLIQGVDRDLGDIARQLDSAHREFKEPVPSYRALEEKTLGSVELVDPEVRRLVEEIQQEVRQKEGQVEDSVMQVDRRVAALDTKLEELRQLGVQIESEKIELEEERDRILEEKQEVEQREQLFSMGFYASLTTTFLAFAGLLVRLPTARLERRLKTLEIEHKEFELAKLRSTGT